MYVYEFINKNNEIIYIGKTVNLNIRMYQHFNDGHLSKKCYNETCNIKYSECLNRDDMSIKERYLINKFCPKYNQQYNNNSKFNFSINDFDWKQLDKSKIKIKSNCKKQTYNLVKKYIDRYGIKTYVISDKLKEKYIKGIRTYIIGNKEYISLSHITSESRVFNRKFVLENLIKDNLINKDDVIRVNYRIKDNTGTTTEGYGKIIPLKNCAKTLKEILKYDYKNKHAVKLRETKRAQNVLSIIKFKKGECKDE